MSGFETYGVLPNESGDSGRRRTWRPGPDRAKCVGNTPLDAVGVQACRLPTPWWRMVAVWSCLLFGFKKTSVRN